MPLKILISAGEASGDWYAAQLTAAMREVYPDAEFFGCAGPRMQKAGVRAIVDSSSLAVVGLVEVVGHIPRIYGEFRKLKQAIDDEKPDLAILTDSPDFHFRLLPQLCKRNVPTVYFVAPQVWAWRKGRLKTLQTYVDHLLCIFPFEEEFFRSNDVEATYIGHPLAHSIKPTLSRQAFLEKHRLRGDRPIIAILPGSRAGEARRHLAPLASAVEILSRDRRITFAIGTPLGFSRRARADFWKPFSGKAIQVLEGETWDLLAHSDLALAASGTVTVEAALLGCPMVTFYRVTAASWAMGKLLVRVPYYSMVNLVAGKRVVPELMQHELTGPNLAREAARLLDDDSARSLMKADLAAAAAKLKGDADPMRNALSILGTLVKKKDYAAAVPSTE
ncbi:MAG TPA: lipid-A-disaccharide synthase [Bryobacteraceae bacterium]